MMTKKVAMETAPMTRRRFGRRSAAVAMTFALAACGGGGDDGAGSFILTAFLLTAVVGGVADGNISVRPTGSGFLSLEPGVALTINSDVPVTFTVSPTSLTIATPVVTSRSWSTAGVTTSVAGQFVITAALVGDPSVNASITVYVTPK